MYYTIGMNSFDLLRITDLKKVPVYNFRLGDKKACCTSKFIALDYSRIETDRECKRLLAEEMGHVLWVATYPLSYCTDSLKEQNVKQQERRAKNYAIRLTVPLHELKTAIKNGLDDYDIAEMLDIDLPDLAEAVDYYKRKKLL